WIDHAAGNLEADLVFAEPILADEHHVLVVGQRDHVDPVTALDQRERAAANARVRDLDERGAKHLVLVPGRAAFDAPLQIVIGHCIASWPCHLPQRTTPSLVWSQRAMSIDSGDGPTVAIGTAASITHSSSSSVGWSSVPSRSMPV